MILIESRGEDANDVFLLDVETGSLDTLFRPQERSSYACARVANTNGVNDDGLLDPATRMGTWHTQEQDSLGTHRFPNGEYVVTVYAYNFKGNLGTRSDTVRVAN